MVPSPPMSRALISAAVLSFLLAGCRDAESPAPPATTSTVAPSTPGDATTVAPPAPATQPAEVPPPTHDVTGGYFPMAELPAPFAELEHLLLATIDENAAPAPLNGFLRSKKRDAQDYTLVSPKLDGKNLTFRTVAVDGVHYEFSGTFEVLDHFAVNPPPYETAVLTGTLTKMKNGQTVASTPVKFRYEAGG